MHVQQMRTLLNDRDQKEVLDRLSKVRPDSQRRWGSMSAHQMICHLSDSFRVALGEKHVSLPRRSSSGRSTSGRLFGCLSGGRTASRHDLKLISSRAVLAPLNFHQMSRTFAFCLNGSAVGSMTSLLTRCSVSYRGLSECATPTSTWITT
jgi:hypothetical protein